MGLGEYLDQVDPDRLRRALEDVREVVEWERAQGKTTAAVARGITTSPMVRNLSDLKVGMQLFGTVANLTNFGASFISPSWPMVS